MVIKNDEILKKVLASVNEDIFKDVRYFLTGTASDVITQILLKGGAKQEVHITDFLTHLLVGNDPDENDVGEVRDIYQKPIVNIKWPVLSAKCGKILPTKAFDPDESKIFTGVKVSLSKVSSQDARSLWGLITYYGGQCILNFDNTCSHLIVGEPNGVKLQRAYEKKVLIVTPDWVTDSVDAVERKDEFFYHPRLLNLSPSATPLPPSSFSKECHELKKFEAEQEAERIALQSQPEVPIYQQPEVQESKGIFDSLVFSDDDDESSNPEQKSLLDQLKNAQTWKSSSSSSSPVQLLTKTIEKNDLFSVDPNNSPKPLFDTVGDSFSSQPFGIDSSLLSSLLEDNSLTQSTNQPIQSISSSVKLPTSSIKHVVESPSVSLKQDSISFNDSYVAYAEQRLSAHEVPTEEIVTSTVVQKINTTIEQITQPILTPISTSSTSQPIIVSTSSFTSTPSIAIASPQNIGTAQTTMLNQFQSSGTTNIIRTPPPVTSLSNVQSYLPPPIPTTVAVSNLAPPTLQESKQAHSPEFVIDGEKVGMTPVDVPTVKQVIGSTPQIGYENKTPILNVRPGVPVQQQHQMVSQPEVSGAVVRLPVGITPQQLRMMGSEERQRFLEQLHQKQLQEQQQRLQQHTANSVQIRTVTPYSQIRTPQGQIVQHTPVQGWSGSNIAQHRLRTSVPQYAQSQVKSQPVTPIGQPQSWQPQSGPTPSPTGVPVSGQSVSFQIPHTTSDVHSTQSPLPPQSNLISNSQVRTPQSPQIGQQVMLGAQQQTNQAVRHIQVPTTLNQDQQIRQPIPQQQYIVSPGTTARIVTQPGWQQQSQGHSPTTNQTQSLLPQQAQAQLQVQHLREQFPFLNQQEAQQFLHSIPGHLREIQVRDGHGRAEYLNKLEPRERQVVTAVAEFYSRRHQLQQQALQRQQQQVKIGAPQQNTTGFQGQFTAVPHNRIVAGRQLSSGYTNQVTQAVSPSQGSPRLVQTNQVVPQQLTPLASPLASPHNQSPVQREVPVAHTILQGTNVAQNLANQPNLVNAKTKTALTNLLTNRLSNTVHQQGTIVQGATNQIEVPGHVVQKASITPETVQGPNGEHLLVYQRRSLANLTNNVSNNITTRPAVTGGHPTGAMVSSYPRAASVTHGTGGFPVIGSAPPHYPRLHLYGHDINILPRDICMVGCVFYIADYHRDLYTQTIECIKGVIQQHGGEVVSIYDTAKVTHVLCKHQKSPVFKQAVRENKRCITIYWLNDILIRGKMAPPWQAYHLPVPFGDEEKPMRDLIVSLTGFENDERTTIKLMLNLAGAKFTGYFARQNHLLICKRFEGSKVMKAREWKKPTLNAVWLSEMLLGQNVPPLSFYGSRYQHFLDDPLRIDPSLSSYLFNAWKHPISVSKESVEKANAMREKAIRKRKPDIDGNQENKRCKTESTLSTQLDDEKEKIDIVKEEPEPALEHSQETETPRIMFSNIKNKDELEKKVLDLGGTLAMNIKEASHLIVGSVNGTLPRTVKVMCAVSCSKYILSVDWIKDSYTLGMFAREGSYMLNMHAFEKIYNFSLKDTLQKLNRNRLLHGKTFYLTPSVVPGKTWFKDIVECAGGVMDYKRKPLTEIKERNKDGACEYVCITCENDSHLVLDLLREKLPVYYGEFILNAILTQNINVQENIFDYQMKELLI